MNRRMIGSCIGVAALAALSVAPMTAQAEDRCARPNGSVEERACAMAAQGPEALRRFIERTQGIYLLYYWDYARP